MKRSISLKKAIQIASGRALTGLVLVSALCLTGCNGGSTSETSGAEITEGVTQAPVQASTIEAPSGELLITKQPEVISVNAGETALYTVTAVGSGTLSYQWQSRKNADAPWSNSAQSGAETTTLSVATTKGLNGWQFRCIVTDSSGQTVTSEIAAVIVL